MIDWPATIVEFKLTGTTILNVWLDESSENVYNVLVNQQQVGASTHALHLSLRLLTGCVVAGRLHATQNRAALYEVLAGLEASKTYYVQLIKVTEALYTTESIKNNVGTFLGLHGDASIELKVLTRRTRRIEFIGDSMTAGFGTLRGLDFSGTCPRQQLSSK